MKSLFLSSRRRLPPAIDPHLEDLTASQRSAGVIRILVIPAALVLPLITWIIYLVAGWIAMLVGIAGNLILLPLAVPLAAGTIWLAVTVLKALLSK